MMEQFSPGTRRALALGLLAAALLAVDSLALAPWRAQRAAYQAQSETDRAMLLRYRAGLAQLRAEVAALGRLQADPALQAAFLAAGDGAAASQLQEQVKRAAEAENIQISSLQILPARTAEGATRQGLAVALEAPFPALVRLIQTIEAGPPAVRLSRLELQSQDSGAAVLTVAFTAEGLLAEPAP